MFQTQKDYVVNGKLGVPRETNFHHMDSTYNPTTATLREVCDQIMRQVHKSYTGIKIWVPDSSSASGMSTIEDEAPDWDMPIATWRRYRGRETSIHEYEPFSKKATREGWTYVCSLLYTLVSE